jgi:putative tricarboxylic transport membrane protein
MMLTRDGIAGFVCLAIAIALLWLTRGLPSAVLVPIGPAFYPRVILGLTAVLSLILIVFDLRVARRTKGAPSVAVTAPAERPNYRLVLATFVLFGLYIALLPELGFRIATVLFVGVLQVTLEWPRSWKHWLMVLMVAVGTTLVCQFVFEDYLSVLLPRGRWSGL